MSGLLEPQDVRALVERASQSDPDAWEALYVYAYARLLDFARRRLGSREEADDAVSEAFARAYGAIRRFRWKGAGFDGWIYGILRNVVLEHYRDRARRVPHIVDSALDDPEPLERVLADEEEAAVRDAFGRLSPEDREVLELRVVGRLDAKQAAVVLGKRPGAVRMAQSRALGRLRALMEGQAG